MTLRFVIAPARPNRSTLTQLRMVIVTTTLVGCLLHETGCLPAGKFKMLKPLKPRGAHNI